MKLTAVARRAAFTVALSLPLLAGPVLAASPATAQSAPQIATAPGPGGNTDGTAPAPRISAGDRADTGPAMAPRCGWLPGAYEPYNVGFSGAGIRLRSGPSTTCTVLGLGYAGQSATLRCGAVGDDGWGWYYVRNNSTGVTGFVRGDGLTGVPISTLAC
ncbi:SH3 domain-containing protein [Micromonospora sp. KC723]|uniref:SH3 domain-containing protein n=1 Tax=Micromonospora sp. KC723 TaxID=2530381 RepID=UPI00104C0881|nr:SH3 domain-containing protein [Micromonospora sp. KC723]TDB76768.1 SH3 domain-containing protein [Micromonospora sp. KC723]